MRARHALPLLAVAVAGVQLDADDGAIAYQFMAGVTFTFGGSD